MLTRTAFIVTAVAAFGLSACGGGSGGNAQTSVAAASDDSTHDMSTMADAAPAAGALFNEADVEFAQGMIPHHEQAIEMSDIALDPTIGAGAQVQDLARQIKAAQDPEIEQMTALLAAWEQPVTMDMTAEEMANMDGMMSAADLDALGALTNAEFDRAWAASMIEHHTGAIAMAQVVKANGKNPETLALADAIIAGQTAEIATLQAMIE